MRSVLLSLAVLLVGAPLALSDEPERAVPTEIPKLETLLSPETEKKNDVWEWAPHLSLRLGRTTQGHYQSRYWYRVQDRRFPVPEARTFEADLSAGRWSVSGSLTRVEDQPDLSGSAFRLALAPANIGPIRPGLGFRYQRGQDATVLFSSGGTIIASASERQLITSVVELGIGRYDKSNLRLQGFYGNARLTDSLDLVVNGRIADSPLARHHFSHSDFFGIGAEGAIRLYGLTLEGSIACYRPRDVSIALPDEECVATFGGSALLPLWLKLGSGAGVFIRYTEVNHHRPPDHQSLQFLNDHVTYGLTIRLP